MGTAAELAVGREATAPGASGGAGARPATQGVRGGLRGRALVALAGNGGLGRARVAVATGSVPFGEKGTVSGVRARDFPADLLQVQGVWLMAFVRVPCESLRSTLGWMLGRLWCSRWPINPPRISIISPRYAPPT